MTRLDNAAVLVLQMAFKGEAEIEWLGVNMFRVWYKQVGEGGIEQLSKDFKIEETISWQQ